MVAKLWRSHRKLRLGLLALAAATIANSGPVLGAELAESASVLSQKLHHLRAAGPREWTEFPAEPEGSSLELKFTAQSNTSEHTLVLRQQDVKQTWRVSLNETRLGALPIDENDMVVYLAVPKGALADGANTLRIEQDAKRPQADDVRIGEVVLHARARQELLSLAQVQVEVRDTQTGQPLPARITVVNERGALQTVGASSNEQMAVRPGTVYTATGQARFGLPAGRYTVYAGRGFEYSLDSLQLDLAAGDNMRRELKIRREVPTEGYVACDTHVHTLTHSGHGDATAQERLITLAAEGVELPIATDHNVHVDHDPLARKLGVRKYFTPVIGNEVTTAVGHFNVFPVQAGAKPPDHRAKDWSSIFASIERTPDVKVVILNHARDLHSATRPFGPKLQNAAAGANLERWQLRANAMEIVNSAAVQTDVLQLTRDWMTQLNHGRFLTPVGASDSHDVARHFVGQGRTYLRARDVDPAAIDVGEAVQSFLQGRVNVSYGLLTELTINDRFGPGELASVPDETVRVYVRVLGPHWVRATKLLLFANGQQIREEAVAIEASGTPKPGVLWAGDWQLPRPRHDLHLVAVAVGPGVDGLYWKTAKPYQPTSPEWTASVVGISGAVWLDVDGDGRRTPAVDYARALVAAAAGSLPKLLAALDQYDEAVAIQAAHLWQESGRSLLAAEAQEALKQANPPVRRGVQTYLNALRETQLARTQTP